MYKLVVLCALLAAAAAKPDLLIAPAAYSSTIVEPAKTTISEQASSVIHPSPLNSYVFSAAYPFAHFIKKRSAPLAVSTYIAPTYDINAITYTYPSSLVRHSTIIPTAPVYSTAHFIKKRSAPLFAAPSLLTRSYIASTPLATSYSYINSAPLVSTPYTYVAPSHFIKKRSAPLIASYYTSNYAAPWYTPYSYASAAPIISTPYISSFPFSSLYFKK